MTTDSKLDLYSFQTPNGRRIVVLLEVLGLKFNYHKIDITKGDQFKKAFTELNPYSKIPVIVDINPNTGEKISIFETGSIIEFIVNKYDLENKIHYEKDHPLYWEQQKWLFFTTSSLSPVQGELSYFLNFASQRDDFAIERAQNNVDKVYKALDQRLKENNGWIVGSKVNIVDISAFTFVNRYEFVQLELEHKYPDVWSWLNKVKNIDGFERGYNFE